MGLPNHAWIGDRLGSEEMTLLYDERERTGKPMTILVQEAVLRAYAKN